ncbi:MULTISPECIES: SRPBCC family protein [Streptomyces]|uniref:SRPBCC family protein n=1 Tax=Streptomyces TaxID=1883 RepID=UPI000B03617A|nr:MULTISPECIES: SRPBCC family protein [Streptomyces]MDH6223464.1 putative membrane protein [Streptomyces sp. MJP52]
MSVIEQSIDVEVPVRVAYNQWTQFKTFPRFMDGVKRVDQTQAALTHWVTRIGGRTVEFDAEIVEQVPDRRMRWEALDPPRHTGTVTFEPLDGERCRVTLRIEAEGSHGLLERLAATLGLVRRWVDGSLSCFKEFVEGQGRETGTWRGEISGSHVRPGSRHATREVPTWPTG